MRRTWGKNSAWDVPRMGSPDLTHLPVHDRRLLRTLARRLRLLLHLHDDAPLRLHLLLRLLRVAVHAAELLLDVLEPLVHVGPGLLQVLLDQHGAHQLEHAGVVLQQRQQLASILSVVNLVEVRNDFEQRVVTYMMQIEEKNAEQSKQYSHQLLEALHS